MPYLVDGYNFIFNDPDLALLIRDKGAAAARDGLVALVAAFNARGRKKATLVFDGAPSASIYPRVQRISGVEVIFSTHPEDADAALVELVQASRHRREITVVTDDNTIKRGARELKAAVMGCDEFAKTLEKKFREAARRKNNTPPREKLDGPPAREVSRWLEIFGFKE